MSRKALLTDYVLDDRAEPSTSSGDPGDRGAGAGDDGNRDPCHGRRSRRQRPLGGRDSQVCWERSVETLTARKDEIAGFAVASDERIEAYLLYVRPRRDPRFRSFVEDNGAASKQLLQRPGAQGSFQAAEGYLKCELSRRRSCSRRSVSAQPAGISRNNRAVGIVRGRLSDDVPGRDSDLSNQPGLC